MLDPSYPIRKFQDLLDRLNHNDGRYFQCLANLARDFQMFAPQFVEVLDLSLQRLREPPKNLYFLYVLDCISKTLPRVYSPLFANRLYRMFMHAYKFSDAESAFQLMRLLEAWESMNPPLFPQNLLENMRDGLGTSNSAFISPDSPETQAFDIAPVLDWISQRNEIPAELALQATEDTYPLLFARLVASEKNKCEFENITQKAGLMPNFNFEEGIKPFSLESEISEHLDWHYAKNKKEKDKVQISPWLPTREVWTDPQQARLGAMVEGGSQDTKMPTEQLAVCDPGQLECILCGELFELVPGEQDWRCRDAVVVYLEDKQKNVLLHTTCYQSLSAMDIERPVPQTVGFQDAFT